MSRDYSHLYLHTPEMIENLKANERAERWDRAVSAGVGIGGILLGAMFSHADGGEWILLAIIAMLAFRIFKCWWYDGRKQK